VEPFLISRSPEDSAAKSRNSLRNLEPRLFNQMKRRLIGLMIARISVDQGFERVGWFAYFFIIFIQPPLS